MKAKLKKKSPELSKKLQMLPVDHLLFDPQNPRFPRTGTGDNEPDAIRWMIDNANIIELMNSIGEQGFFLGEPLVVIPSQTKGKFDVVEGNRRLTAVRLLSDPTLAPSKKKSVEEASATATHRPKEVPCLVFDKQEEVLHYLAFRHVTGVQPWNPLQKARYLRRLAITAEYKALAKPELRRRLAREIGTRPDYVGKLLAGLAVYESIEEHSFFDIPGLEDAEGWYTVLTTAITSYSSIAGFVGLSSVTDDDASKLKQANLKKLANWLFLKNSEGVARVRESRDIQKLGRVVANSDALKKFESGSSLEDADLLTEGPLEAFRESLRQAKSRLELARDLVPKLGKSKIEEQDFENIHEVKVLAATLESSAKTVQEMAKEE
jgi:hypothetical protein